MKRKIVKPHPVFKDELIEEWQDRGPTGPRDSSTEPKELKEFYRSAKIHPEKSR